MLVIFATNYDDVTAQTCGIAQRLRARADDVGIPTLCLFAEFAVRDRLLAAVARRPTVLAFYAHGDDQGRVISQDRDSCWSDATIPDLKDTAVYAHACRSLRWLAGELQQHRARLIVGYEIDLYTPVDGSGGFWHFYREIHSFVPHRLVQCKDHNAVRSEFHAICTTCLHELDAAGAPLMELIAIGQSRDHLKFMLAVAPQQTP